MQALTSKVPVGTIFRHYKGKEYKILQVGRHSEDLSLYVVYQGLYICKTFGKDPIWIRPLEMFLETVRVESKEVPRFSLLTPSPTHS
ncbi:MAG: hypothetical protein KR126chlam1_00219 [Chlamydiae bacterium]|nr:hypothetical protein [Chlamydiota bacterium]